MRERPIVWHLAALAMGAAAPFVALAAYLAIELIGVDMEQATANVEHFAQSTAHRAERMVDGDRAILAGLATRPGVSALDPDRCDPLLRDLLALHPELADVITLGSSGGKVCSAAQQRLAADPAMEPGDFFDDLGTRDTFTSGRAIRDHQTHKWITSEAQPVLAGDGSVLGAVAISIDLLKLSTLIAGDEEAREPVMYIMNSHGIVLAHHPDSAAWLGRDLSETPITRLALERKSGSAREKGTLGVERLWAFAPVRGTDWTVLSGIPMTTVMAPVYRTVIWVAALSAGSIAFVIALCIALARPISRPIAAIATAARRMSSHDSLEHLVPSGPDEVAALAEDLNRMLDRRMFADQELRERDNELSLLMDNYPGWVMHLDCDLRYRYVNSGYMAVTGRSSQDLLGANVRDVVGDSRFQMLEPLLTRALCGARQSFEDERQTVAGTTVSMSMTLVPDVDAGGAVQGIFVFGSDITERKLAEETVRALNMDLERRVADRTAELEAVNRELESFDYSISHDLRAPINRICGFSEELLADAPEINPQTRDLLGRIQASAVSMDQLVSDLLSLSTLSRGELQCADVDLSTLARSALEALQGTAPDRKVKLIVASGVRAVGDPGLIRIVLANLLGNAWKFTSRREGAQIEFGTDLDNGAPRFFVRDNGAGFDMAFAGKLFEPFRRLHAQSEFKGTGIGLATVERVVRRHGGRVWAEGAVGRGATIYFTLSPERSDGASRHRAAQPICPEIS
jgi:PAS domain S-box-containing protein